MAGIISIDIRRGLRPLPCPDEFDDAFNAWNPSFFSFLPNFLVRQTIVVYYGSNDREI